MINTQFLYLICLSVVEIFGDFSLEKFTRSWELIDLGKGIGFYGGVIFFLIKSLIGSNILYVNGMWDGLSGLIESLAAFWFLGERFESFTQYIGLFMIIIGIVLLKNK